LIRGKIEEYLNRAETLKTHLVEATTNKKKPVGMGNGTAKK
jgi:hypothetical protein